MFYDYKENRNHKDYIDSIQEINAYIKNEYEESFNFGEGEMRMEQKLGSEIDYYKIEIENLIYKLNNFNYIKTVKNKRDKYHYNKYYYKQKEKIKLFKLYKSKPRVVSWTDWYYDQVTEKYFKNKGRLKRNYLPPRARYLRNISDRKVRRYKDDIKNGGHYRKIFDYEWELD